MTPLPENLPQMMYQQPLQFNPSLPTQEHQEEPYEVMIVDNLDSSMNEEEISIHDLRLPTSN